MNQHAEWLIPCTNHNKDNNASTPLQIISGQVTLIMKCTNIKEHTATAIDDFMITSILSETYLFQYWIYAWFSCMNTNLWMLPYTYTVFIYAE